MLRIALHFLAVIAIGSMVHPAHAQRVPGVVRGTMEDAETGEPVAYAQVLLEGAGRSTATGEDGHFEIAHVPEGVYTLKTFRIGYEPIIQTIRVNRGDTVSVQLRAESSALAVGEVVVEGSSSESRQLLDAAMQLEGRRLRQHLGTTIAETLNDEPGIAMRSMGPAPARPVLRGLGGERLLVLEDGERTGDMSATSSDHALVVDPMIAERIEVVRGPAALAYGSNTLGGVVNVVRGYIPKDSPRRVTTGIAVQGQTVNRGVAGGISVGVPVGRRFVVRGDATIRRADDVRTPSGALGNTALSTENVSLGGSVVGAWGYAGIAGSHYSSAYGIPGGFVGAHPNGVDVRLTRTHAEVRSELRAISEWISRVEVRGAYARYHHQEFESNGNLGIEYGLLTYSAGVTAHVNRAGAEHRGELGIWAGYRDYAAGGYAFTPASVERSAAGFLHQDLHFSALTLQGGIRYDVRQVRPATHSGRDLGGMSAAATIVWHAWNSTAFGVSGVRSLRMPGIEELYSEGPHLAAYSFEVGNPALNAERGWGAEVFGRHESRRVSGSIAAYRYWIADYIFPINTGEINNRVFLPIYRYSGATARITGAEGRLEFQLSRGFSTTATAAYSHGSLPDLEHAIPWMPPFQGSIGLEKQWRPVSLGITARMAARQDRLGPFESATDGYFVVDLYAQYHFTNRGLLHTFDLAVQNVGDGTYRDHLSRVKSVMPEPGRNVRLLYRLYL